MISRALTIAPGSVYSLRQLKQDLDAIYSTGIFEDVNMVPSSSDEPGKVDLTVNVVERKTGGFSAGGGMSARGLAEGALSGVVGSCTYSQKNLFGLNQKLTASVEMGQVDSLFRVNYVDPWIRSDPHRTSRSITVQNTRSSGAAGAVLGGWGGGWCTGGGGLMRRVVGQSPVNALKNRGHWAEVQGHTASACVPHFQPGGARPMFGPAGNTIHGRPLDPALAEEAAASAAAAGVRGRRGGRGVWVGRTCLSACCGP